MLWDDDGRLLPPLACSSLFANFVQRPLLNDCWNILSTSSCLLISEPITLSR
jgi:hypothetical protein